MDTLDIALFPASERISHFMRRIISRFGSLRKEAQNSIETERGRGDYWCGGRVFPKYERPYMEKCAAGIAVGPSEINSH